MADTGRGCALRRLTLSFDFERLTALVAGVAAVVVTGLQRLVEAVGPAGRRLQAAAPARRLGTRPPHQVLHPHHHLPGDCEDFVLNSQRGLNLTFNGASQTGNSNNIFKRKASCQLTS